MHQQPKSTIEFSTTKIIKNIKPIHAKNTGHPEWILTPRGLIVLK